MLQSMRSFAKYIWIIVFAAFVGLLAFEGLMDRPIVSPGDAVGEVNGRDVNYGSWLDLTNELSRQREAELGRGINLDERRFVEEEAFEQLVMNELLRQEISRRGISVTDAEILQAARSSPPPMALSNPEFQTDGQFDFERYQRFLNSPIAQQQGALLQLEEYYRQEIPRMKLFEQVSTGAYISDSDLWRVWQDTRDSAVVSYVGFRPADVDDSDVTITDQELRTWYNANRSQFDRPGRAVVSVVELPRTITAEDSVASLERARHVRERLVGGEDFGDVARYESADPGSAMQGGELGRNPLSLFVPEFADAARALPIGEISEPVLTQFGYHLLIVDERSADTASVRHILLPVQQSDSNAVRVDRQADRLANLAALSESPAVFDSAAEELELEVRSGTVTEGQRLVLDGVVVPDVGGWAFSGAEAGETSDLVVSDEGYYLARLDSLFAGGVAPFEQVREEVRARLLRERKLDALAERAREFSQQASRTSLEQAAEAGGRVVAQTEAFTRVSGASGIGVANRAVGAAFSLPVGAVSQPIRTDDAIFIMRVDSRVNASREDWELQRDIQRQMMNQQYRQRVVQEYLSGLRSSADVEDYRSRILRTLRRSQT